MKKILSCAFLLCICICLPLFFASCGDEQLSGHEHTESNWIIDKAATCQQKGLRHRECTQCGKELVSEEYRIGHQYENNICKMCGLPKYDEQYLVYEPVTLPDGTSGYTITGMGNCSAAYVTVPATYKNLPVLGVSDGAFENNTQLITVSFPDCVREVGARAFFNCKNLTSVTFSEKSECTRIGKAAFSMCPLLGSAALPPLLSIIESECFAGCEKLTALTLPRSLTGIGDDALSGCDALSGVEKGGVRYLGTEDAPYLVALGPADKEKLTRLVFDESTKIIVSYAFAGCRSLTAVTLPEGLTRIPAYAFSGCTALTQIAFPATLTEISNGAFAGCTGLTALVLPAGLTTVGSAAFKDCTALTNVTFPATLEYLGGTAFSGCEALIRVAFLDPQNFSDTDGKSVTLSDPTANATLLKTIGSALTKVKKGR